MNNKKMLVGEINKGLYIYIHTYIHICIYVYMYVYREKNFIGTCKMILEKW
jgi:hypothetical protein